MRHDANKLRNWLSEQINNYLTTKQGCVSLTRNTKADIHKMIVQDIFGQCYEITVRAMTNTLEGQGNDYENILKRNIVGISQSKNVF